MFGQARTILNILFQFILLVNRLECKGVSFEDEKRIANMQDRRVTYAAGLAASRKHRGVLYTHNNLYRQEPFVYAINESNAAIISTLRLFPAENQNWEDIAVGPCGDKSCIYIGDSTQHKIYRVEEPDYIYTDQILTDVSAVKINWNNTFASLMVDRHGNVFIVRSHTNDDRLIGRLAANQWNNTHTVNLVTTNLPHLPRMRDSDPKSADISPDGAELLLLTHHTAFYWKILDDSVLTSIKHHYTELPTKTSKLVKGIAWDSQGRNYYEISVGDNTTTPSLYIYHRL